MSISLSPLLIKRNVSTQKEVETVIQDEEIEMLKLKFEDSYKLYHHQLHKDAQFSLKSGEMSSRIASQNSLFDLDPGLQDKIRKLFLHGCQRNTYFKDPEFYPALVYDDLEKKLQIRKPSQDLPLRVCHYFKKQIKTLSQQENFLYNKSLHLQTFGFRNENFSQLIKILDNYGKKLRHRKTMYLDGHFRLSQGLENEQKDRPQINAENSNNLIFTQGVQPTINLPIKALDYKLYLNDKLNKYKVTRNLNKFGQIIKHFPARVIAELYPIKDPNIIFNNAKKKTVIGSETVIEDFLECGYIKEIDTLKEKLVMLCEKFDLEGDINIDNGAFLLFQVDCYFKETFVKQQARMNYAPFSSENKNPHGQRESLKQSVNKYIQKASWLEEQHDFGETLKQRDFHGVLHEDCNDSLLNSWLSFVQISELKESQMKLDFHMNRLKDQYEERKIFPTEIFFQFFKAYLKLQIISARQNILKIYDSLNFFRSIEKKMYHCIKEMHSLERQDLKIQDNVIFKQNSIEVYGQDQREVIYDVVIKDFENLTSSLLKTGAHFIDQYNGKDNFGLVSDDVERESLLARLLENEANYQFAKAKYINCLMKIFENNFKIKNAVELTSYIQKAVLKRPRFDEFKQCLDYAFKEETKHYERLEKLTSSLIEHQKTQERELDDYLESIFTPDDLEQLSDDNDVSRDILSQSELNEEENRKIMMEKESAAARNLLPCSSMQKIFSLILNIEKSVENSVTNLKFDNRAGVSLAFQVQKLLLEEALEMWEQIIHNLALDSSIKEYESYHYDVLLDIPDATYNLLNPLKKQPTDNDLKKNNNKQQQKQTGYYLSEKEYFCKFIEFVRLKETTIESLLSSAYQAQIYLHQIRLFNKDAMYREIKNKNGDFSKNFLGWLLNLDAVNYCFQLKDLGNLKTVIFDPTKLDELWRATEYLLLNEKLLENAINMNYFYILDVREFSENDNSQTLRNLKSHNSQNVFYNIIERKSSWMLQAKINPVIFMGEKFRPKTETLNELTHFIKQNVFYDALRIQTIDIFRLLRKLVGKVKLDKSGIFTVLEGFTKDQSALLTGELSEIAIDEDAPSALIREKQQLSQVIENHFDELGYWCNPFILPATQDIMTSVDFGPDYQLPDTEGTMIGGGVKKKQSKISNLAQAVKLALEDAAHKKQKKKKEINFQWINERSQLEPLRDCSLMCLLEWGYYLFEILKFEVLEVSLQADLIDLVVFYEGGPDEDQTYIRNKLRLDHGFIITETKFRKLKEHIGKLMKKKKEIKKKAATMLFRKRLKYLHQVTLLANLQCVLETRKYKDDKSLRILRQFLIENYFPSIGYLFKIKGDLKFHPDFKTNNSHGVMKQIDFENSEILRILDFAILDDHQCHGNSSSSSYFLSFGDNYRKSVDGQLLDLLLLKKSLKTEISAQISDLNQYVERNVPESILVNEDWHQYFVEGVKIFKENIRTILLEEMMLCLKEHQRPFIHLIPSVIDETTKGVRHRYNSMLGASEETPRGMKNTKILRTCLNSEYEKMMLQEGISHYTKNFADIFPSKGRVERSNHSPIGIGSLQNLTTPEGRFLPFLYGFSNKILKQSSFIQANNLGECLVLPVASFEQSLGELNTILLEYFQENDNMIKRDFADQIILLNNQVNIMKADHEKMTHQVKNITSNQERIVESRLAEESTRVLFQVDMLKKQIKYILEEHKFSLKEAEDKVREDFKNKLIKDEVAMKQVKKRFFEYKEGMSFDLRKFIENEKNSTLRAINEKKNQIFMTSHAELNNKIRIPRDQQDTPKSDEVDDSHLVKKLYELLKKTRVLYQFREIVTREKCEKQINEMQKKLLDNQNLLHKLNDLQTSEATLKDNLTEAKKEIVLMERRNQTLRTNLHRDSAEKIKIYKEFNTSKTEFNELKSKYEDSLTVKAIFIPEAENSKVKNPRQNQFFLKSHIDTISNLRSRQASTDSIVDFGESVNVSTAFQRNSTVEEAPQQDNKASRKRLLSASRTSATSFRPMTAQNKTHSRNNSTLNLTLTKPAEDSFIPPAESSKKNQRMKSYVDLKPPKELMTLGGFNMKTGKKAKRKDRKGVLLKKFVAKDPENV